MFKLDVMTDALHVMTDALQDIATTQRAILEELRGPGIFSRAWDVATYPTRTILRFLLG